MKKKFPLNVLLLTLVVSCVLVSCLKNRQDSSSSSPDSWSGFSLAEIKGVFESYYAVGGLTRSDGASDEPEVLAPGWIIPLWDSAVLYDDEYLSQADVMFDARYEYRLLRWDEAGSPSLLPMSSRLVVLKNMGTGKTASYLRFLIPDANYTASDTGEYFTGLVLYTLLSGVPVSVGRFDSGTLAESASFWDNTRTWEESADRMTELLQDVNVARVRTEAATRMGGEISPVEIVGYPPIKVRIPMQSELPPVQPPDDKLNIGYNEHGGGDGSGSSDSDSKKSYPSNPKISVDKEKLKEILDLIYDDCMGQLLINAIKSDVTITSGYFGGSSVRPIMMDLPTGRLILGYDVRMGYRLDPLTVMEELMHIYQGLGTADYQRAAMNYEVEAKLAWYMYWKKTNSTINIESALGGEEGKDQFEIMRYHLLKNDLGNPAFIEAYENAVGALRNINAYKDENRYIFDPGKMDCEKLIELVKDCLDK